MKLPVFVFVFIEILSGFYFNEAIPLVEINFFLHALYQKIGLIDSVV